MFMQGNLEYLSTSGQCCVNLLVARNAFSPASKYMHICMQNVFIITLTLQGNNTTVLVYNKTS